MPIKEDTRVRMSFDETATKDSTIASDEHSHNAISNLVKFFKLKSFFITNKKAPVMRFF